MPRVDPVQSNFTAGEVSPKLFGNFEIEKYKQALATCNNAIVEVTGGVRRRGGTEFIKEVKDSADTTILQKFSYKGEDHHILEFGDLYIRVYKDRAQVLDGTPVEIVTTYTKAQVSDLRFTQDEEALYITHKDHAPAKLTRTSDIAWTLTNLEFDILTNKLYSVCWSPELSIFVAVSIITTDNYVKISKDGIYWETYLTGIDEAWASICWSSDLELFCAVGDDAVMTSPDGITWTERTPAEANGWIDVVWGSGAGVFVAISLNGTNRVMTSPDGVTWTARSAASSETWIKVCWSEESTLFVAVATTSGTYDCMYSADGISWTGVVISGDTWASICWSQDLELFCIVSGDAPVPGSQVYTSPDAITWTGRTGATNDVDWRDIIWASELTLFIAISNEGTVDQMIMTSPDGITWTSRTAPKAYRWEAISYSPYLKKLVAIAFSEDGYLDAVMTSIDGITWTIQYTTGISSPEWVSGNYPSLCWFFEQRFFLASTPDQPNKVWGSRTTQYNVFDIGTGLDNEAIAITLKEVTKLLWAISSTSIILGADNGVFKLASNASNEAMTPSNARPVRLLDMGGAFIDALNIDGKVVYVQKGLKKLKRFEYELISDTYKTTNLLILCNHLTGSGLTKIVYVDEPNSIIYGLRSDGKLMGLTYDIENNIYGGFLLEIGGTDTAITSIAISGDSDEIWLIVSRTIDGGTVQYVEILTEGLEADDDIEDATFADSFVTKTGSGFTTFDGLDHLEGETVQVLADGLSQGAKVVSSGAVTITAADKATAGLPYTTTLETLPIEGGNPIGSAMSKIKRISKVVLRLYRSSTFLLSDLLDNTPDIIDVGYGYTGDTDELDFYGTHEQGGQIKITCISSNGFNLLSIMYKARTGE